MSNTELDTKGVRDKKALIKYLADYIEHERIGEGWMEAIGEWINFLPQWIAEGIEAFESIHDVEVCVFDNPLKRFNAPAEGEKGN